MVAFSIVSERWVTSSNFIWNLERSHYKFVKELSIGCVAETVLYSTAHKVFLPEMYLQSHKITNRFEEGHPTP